ncbi:unnamed protein product [Withania somnifera]
MITSGFRPRSHILNRLIDIYCKNSGLVYAKRPFDKISQPDVVARITMIAAYSASEEPKLARDILDKTPLSIRDTVSLSLIADHEMHCRQQHSSVVKSGMANLKCVVNALISVYVRCASSPLASSWLLMDSASKLFYEMPERDYLSWTMVITGYVKNDDLDAARKVFDGMDEKLLVAWNAIISGYVHNCFIFEALDMLRKMYLAGMKLYEFNCTSILRKQVHAYVGRTEEEIRASVCNALKTLYWKCGRVDDARKVFDNLVFKDLVSWNVVLSAYVSAGRINKAKLFLDEIPEKNSLAWTVMISGLAQNELGEDGLKLLSAGNTLVTFYRRSGVIEAARNVFLAIPSVDLMSWNALVAALGQHGYGKHYFNIMYCIFKIKPGEDHYARLIDLLSRVGRLLEAKEVIQNMPYKPGAPIREALLAGCRTHGNVDLGVEAAEKLSELTPQHDGMYILLANTFAAAGRWDDAAKVRKLMRDQGVKKEPGCSWIKVENTVHVFLVAYNYLEELRLKTRKMGYVSDTQHVLHDMETEQKEYALSTHSEKLGLVFGLLKLPRGATIRVFKNLRDCGDCHNVFKFMSMVEAREIIVIDGNRLHHFRDGECSCGNYW